MVVVESCLPGQTITSLLKVTNMHHVTFLSVISYKRKNDGDMLLKMNYTKRIQVTYRYGLCAIPMQINVICH